MVIIKINVYFYLYMFLYSLYDVWCRTVQHRATRAVRLLYADKRVLLAFV
jgi:hypothetical protein